MKLLRNISLLGSALALSNCATIKQTTAALKQRTAALKQKVSQPIGDNGYNPLDKPSKFRKVGSSFGSTGPSGSGVSASHSFKKGDLVEVAIDKTAMFKKVPKSGDRYSKVLKAGENLKVLDTENEFLKVATSSGETGYVSSVMVISRPVPVSQNNFVKPPVKPIEAPVIKPVGNIAPPPEIPGLDSLETAPAVPIPVPTVTTPIELDPIPVPTLGNPTEVIPSVPTLPSVPTIPDPSISLPDPVDPLKPLIPSLPGGIAPEPEIPGLPQ